MGAKCFVIEFETGLTKKDRDLCEKKLRVGKQIYNSALGTAIKRAKSLYHDPEYIACKKALADLYQEADKRGDNVSEKKSKSRKPKRNVLPDDLAARRDEIYAVMNALRAKHQWNGKYCLNDQRTKMKQHFDSAIGTTVVSQMVMRAQRTVEKIEKSEKEKIAPDGTKSYVPFDERIRAARFVGRNEDFSIESSSPNNGIYYRNGLLYFDRYTFIDVDASKCDKYEYYREAMRHKMKYCRLISRTIRGQKRYYVQLILDGVPPMGKRNYAVGKKVDLVDVKISHYDIRAKNGVEEIELAPKCKVNEEKIAELNRKMDSSRRANNPEKYNPDGTINMGAKRIPWVESNRYKKLKAKHQDISRKNAATRKICLEKQANEILEQGTDITIQHLSYKKLQKRKDKTEINEKTGQPKTKSVAGKAIANRSPSYFVSALVRKASYVDGEVIDLSGREKLTEAESEHVLTT